MAWVFFTLLAAFMQSWRNAFQAKLAKEVDTLGVTLSRFLWAVPIAAVYLAGLYSWQPVAIPDFNGTFFSYVVGAAFTQILATAWMVKLFKLRNFTIGAGLAKSEALFAALLAVLLYSAELNLMGWVGVIIGSFAIFHMSGGGDVKNTSWQTLLLGLACGCCFAMTSLWIRQASFEMDLPFLHRAAWVLLFVLCVQTTALVGYLLAKDPGVIKTLLKRNKEVMLVGFCGCVGSIGWFTAMAIEEVAYVKILGQIEVFFTMAISAWYLKQKPKKQDVLGLLLIALAAILVIWRPEI